ncbi:LIC_13387 family protein [Nonomuraea endophytica]|uniref:LIC_13387 family protein n=1 Tax=Nonomuraea endophytica TaxID=714136 RepID=UPI0037C936A6
MNTSPNRLLPRATAVGAWCMMIAGAGHLLGSVLPIASGAFEGEAGAREAMRAAPMRLGLHTNFELLFDAMSSLMSVMFIGFGVITLAVARNAAELLARSPLLRGFNLLLSLACLAIAGHARLLPPMILMSIAAAAFAVALPARANTYAPDVRPTP